LRTPPLAAPWLQMKPCHSLVPKRVFPAILPLPFCFASSNPLASLTNPCALLLKKIINLLTVTVLFLFTFFTLILDAPRTSSSLPLQEVRKYLIQFSFTGGQQVHHQVFLYRRSESTLSSLPLSPPLLHDEDILM
jgi:hypothetical protein